MLNFLQKTMEGAAGRRRRWLFLAFLAFSLLIGHQVREAVAAAQGSGTGRARGGPDGGGPARRNTP